MFDQNGNPIVWTPISMLQALFNPLKRIIRIGRGATDAFIITSRALTVVGTAVATDAAGNSSIAVDSFTELAVDVNVTAISGVGATYTLLIDRLGSDGIWYTIYTGANITAIGSQSVSLGVGASTNVSFGKTIRVRETVAGTTPSITHSISIIGK